MKLWTQQTWPIMAVLLIAGASFAIETTEALYTTPAGKTYSLRTGTSSGVECGPVSGGFNCSVAGKIVVNVRDRSGCGLVRDGAACMIGDDSAGEFIKGASTLECVSGVAYLLAAGPEASCDANSGLSMTCNSPDGKHYADASCDAGCTETGGHGICALARTPFDPALIPS